MALSQPEIDNLVVRAQECATHIKNAYMGIRKYIRSQRTVEEFNSRLAKLGEFED